MTSIQSTVILCSSTAPSPNHVHVQRCLRLTLSLSLSSSLPTVILLSILYPLSPMQQIQGVRAAAPPRRSARRPPDEGAHRQNRVCAMAAGWGCARATAAQQGARNGSAPRWGLHDALPGNPTSSSDARWWPQLSRMQLNALWLWDLRPRVRVLEFFFGPMAGAAGYALLQNLHGGLQLAPLPCPWPRLGGA